MVGRQVQPSGPPRRIVQWEIPLWQLVAAVIAFLGTSAGFAISFYNQSQQNFALTQDLSKKIIELTAEIKIGTQQGSVMSGTLNLLQFRVETLEADMRGMKNQPPQSARKP